MSSWRLKVRSVARSAGVQPVPLALAVVLASGCGAPPPSVVIEGSSTVYRISQAAQLGYNEIEPGVRVLLGKKGTSTGFSVYLEGGCDLIDASRAAKPDEEAKAREKGLNWTRFLVGYDGITVVVSRENDFVQDLSVEQLKALFEPESPVKTWKDLDPSWPDRRINLFTPDNDSGTFEFFTEAILGKKAQRKDAQTSPDDNTLVQGVATDADGLGYFGYAYYASNQARLRDVPIRPASDAPAVEPTPATILDGTYRPLARPLYLYAKDAAMTRPEVAAFVKYYLDEIDELATQAGYVPPTAEDKAANAAALSGLMAR